MFKTIIPFYIIGFALYVLFTRHPDYQDGEITTAVIHYAKDSTGSNITKVFFSVGKNHYTVKADYVLRNLKEDENVNVIYDTSDPSKAAVYKAWGYWFRWDELIASVLIPVIFLYAAKAITASPTPEALLDEMEMRNPPKRRKYD